MSDDPVLSSLARLEAGQGRLEAMTNGLDVKIGNLDAKVGRLETDLMTGMNNGFERLIDQMTALRADFQNVKGFLLEDAIVMGRRAFSIEERLARLERKFPD